MKTQSILKGLCLTLAALLFSQTQSAQAMFKQEEKTYHCTLCFSFNQNAKLPPELQKEGAEQKKFIDRKEIEKMRALQSYLSSDDAKQNLIVDGKPPFYLFGNESYYSNTLPNNCIKITISVASMNPYSALKCTSKGIDPFEKLQSASSKVEFHTGLEKSGPETHFSAIIEYPAPFENK